MPAALETSSAAIPCPSRRRPCAFLSGVPHLPCVFGTRQSPVFPAFLMPGSCHPPHISSVRHSPSAAFKPENPIHHSLGERNWLPVYIRHAGKTCPVGASWAPGTGTGVFRELRHAPVSNGKGGNVHPCLAAGPLNPGVRTQMAFFGSFPRGAASQSQLSDSRARMRHMARIIDHSVIKKRTFPFGQKAIFPIENRYLSIVCDESCKVLTRLETEKQLPLHRLESPFAQ